MRSTRVWAALLAVIVACGPEDGPPRGPQRIAGGLVAEPAQAAIVGMTNALSTPAQRHVVRVEPPGRAPVYLMAVQNGGYTDERPGLLLYRSDDLGATWRFYRGAVAAPDPAVYNPSRRPSTLHLTADLTLDGDDVLAVYSYDTTGSGFPADAWDPQRVVHFQRWRFDGEDDWIPDPRITVASPGAGQAYHRAELARDGAGRIWVQSFLRRSGCSTVGSSSCVGDLLQVWVSTDGGATFQGPQNLAELPRQKGGGRLLHLGSQLVLLWGDHSSAPAQLMRRSDADPLTRWSPRVNAFADGAKIYHGAALSAAPDGAGGLHLVYKRWVASPDVHQLYYRHFDGAAFGPAQAFGGAGDWATQPAITAVDGDLYVCVNHLVATNEDYEMRSYRLSSGLSSWEVVDARAEAKAYPAAPERVPSSDGTVPCAYGMGNQTTSMWGPGHTVEVALQPVDGAPAAAAAPAFSPAPGTYTTPQSVALASATPGASIFYTTDGTAPTTAATPYAGPVAVDATTTIRAIATAAGFTQSPVASGTYAIEVPPPAAAAAPTFSPAPGTYASPQSVALASATPGASIFYTTDGTAPTTASTPYTGPVAVDATTTIRAIATAAGFAQSPVASGTYAIEVAPPAAAAAPTFSPSPGTYASPQSVALASATPGASIFYTTDGTAPTNASTPYAGPVAVDATTTIRAIATADGFTQSPVTSGTFTIQAAPAGVLFADEFARTTGLGSAWRTWHGSFRTDGARAISVDGDDNWASVAAPLGTSDYAVEARLSVPSGALYSGVVARSAGGSSFTRDLYSAQISSKGTVSLYRRNAWTWTLLRSVSAGVQAGRTYDLRLVTTGTSPVHLEVWLDGTRLVSYDDASSSRLASGLVGLENYDAGVQYESFRVLAR